MRDLPISFSAPMVRSLLAGTKTQTRRVIRIEAERPIVEFVKVGTTKDTGRPIYEMKDKHGQHVAIAAGKNFVTTNWIAPIAVGDRLYVREHWRVSRRWDSTPPRELPARKMTVFFDAGGSIANQDSDDDWRPVEWPGIPENRPSWIGRHRQGMHMPKWASRITLLVEDVKVERLQDISEEDAEAEGIVMENVIVGATCAGGTHREINGDRYFFDGGDDEGYEWAADAYAVLWDHINGEGAWASNPWIVAYTFRVVLENIDYIGRPA